jgi:hypothetical protein
MWYWIIKVSILSLILIFLLHYLYSFFISTLTVPKIKDLVTLPQQKYDEMFHSLQQQQQQQSQSQQLLNNNINNNGNNNATGNSQSMKDDLINFLKDIGSSSTGNTFSNTNMNENSNNLEYLPMNANTISSYSFNNN